MSRRCKMSRMMEGEEKNEENEEDKMDKGKKQAENKLGRKNIKLNRGGGRVWVTEVYQLLISNTMPIRLHGKGLLHQVTFGDETF